MTQAVIDRFEGDFAVCEKPDRSMLNIHRSKLPSDAREGDVISIEMNIINIDRKATEERRDSIKNIMRDLRRKEKP
jgi:hypothetical protein